MSFGWGRAERVIAVTFLGVASSTFVACGARTSPIESDEASLGGLANTGGSENGGGSSGVGPAGASGAGGAFASGGAGGEPQPLCDTRATTDVTICTAFSKCTGGVFYDVTCMAIDEGHTSCSCDSDTQGMTTYMFSEGTGAACGDAIALCTAPKVHPK